MKIILLLLATLTAHSVFAETLKIDPAASLIEWKAGKKVGSFHNGKIQIKSGELKASGKNVIQSAQITVDMKTLSNDDLSGSPEMQKKLVGHLSSDDFFKVEKFPESSFKLTSIQAKADSKGEFLVKGELTMIGVTQPVEFPAKIEFGKNSISGTGTLKIERLKWGLQYGSGSIFKSLTADKIINDDFELTLKIVAKK
jgi:polyisoprenoid-binding protein YceI